MSNLENLTAKIRTDAQSKAEGIAAAARREAEALLNKADAEARAEAAKARAAAQDEARKYVELAVSAKKIRIRDQMLAAKQATIGRVLDAAKERLSAMDQPAYEAFLLKTLNRMSYGTGERLRVPARYSGLDMAALNAKLSAAGKPALAPDTNAYTESGFKLVRDDIENDNSFDALIDYYRSDLEADVAEVLFHA